MSNTTELEGVNNYLMCDSLEDVNVEDKLPDLVESDSEEDVEVSLIFIKIFCMRKI